MGYIAKVSLQNGKQVYLREPGQPQMIEMELSEGVTLITHSGLSKVLEMDSVEKMEELCRQNNIHAQVLEVVDVF